ncbi:MAG: methionyl-tRNA formyltransferase [Paracoccaceae bacterium]|nr:methionyl-tRNA formyltransferase [Paracoccaceae bacterium]
MRLVFMGSPEFSVPVLEALVEAGHEVVCVYCQPPRPAGRGKHLRLAPVHVRAQALGLLVRHPRSFADLGAVAGFVDLIAEAAVVVAYGLILPQEVLDAPAYGCINIHASLLPRWRGAAPIHRAIMAGDTETGVCIMQMEAGLDTGPVLAQHRLSIEANETTGMLHDKLAVLGAEAIVQTLPHLADSTAVTQPEAGVLYAHKIDKSEACIDWSLPAQMVDRQIRALAPFPGAWTLIGGERVKLLGSAWAAGSGKPGEVLDAKFTVACGSFSVRVTRAQRAGKVAQDVGEFLRGHPVVAGRLVGS